MTHHTLEGRTEQEVLWFQRRSFLQAAAAWTAAFVGLTTTLLRSASPARRAT